MRTLLRNAYLKAKEALEGENVILNQLEIIGSNLVIKDVNGSITKIDLKDSDIHIIGAGKAVCSLCIGFLKFFDSSFPTGNKCCDIKSGILSIPIGLRCHSPLFSKYNVDLYYGARDNIPDEESVRATKKILSRISHIKNSQRKCIVLSFFTGGGSALLTLPVPSMTLQEKKNVIKQLASTGCTINELNAVRGELSLVKKGRLALQLLSDNPNISMVNFIASDVIGDPLDVIASGPTILEKGNLNGIDILKKYYLLEYASRLQRVEIDPNLLSQIEARLSNILILNNGAVIRSIEKFFQSYGYFVTLLKDVQGEAKDVAEQWAVRCIKEERSKVILLGGGETTVKLSKNHGIGGRCQEFVLKFALSTYKHANISCMAIATDGQDGPTNVGGVVYCPCDIKEDILHQASDYLERNDTYHFWTKYAPQSLILTEPSGSNVADIYCAVIS